MLFFGFENLNLYTSTLGLIKITERGMKKSIYSLFFHTAVNKSQEVPQAVHISPLPMGDLFHKFYPLSV